ncbi:4-hydroxythreonine-4-phosphate dehydrogenase PdxA [Treponema socranskii]|nr:4-hydroxythreonine-4-phosphate dehydrogenase PdxA [Treponema socranskii]MDR9858321.1 4-hydroxythreonine-4-phosphate dehydrogenase PdxA [Treponema socranskii]
MRSCKKDREFKCIRLANQACRQLGIEHPKVVLCGLNPHAGENGLFGDEKIKEISPRSERPAHFDKGRRLRV